jgi:hypothetical protein
LLSVLVAVTAPAWFVVRADAALTDVAISPGAGAVGTTVTVSGSACGPGLLVNPSHVGVLGATLGVTIDMAVPTSGAWSTQFFVPTGALQGLHAIVVTCTRDLAPLPYMPLTFTVNADIPAPTTTIDTASVSTTVTSTTVATTIASGPSGSTTIGSAEIAPIIAPFDDPPSDDRVRSGGPFANVAPEPAERLPSTTTEPAVTSTAQPTPAASVEAVSASRTARDDRRRSLVFGALSPIGQGWLRWLVSALVFASVVAGALALLWFRWLRHTRARVWWVRWMHQILHIRSHARPPT